MSVKQFLLPILLVLTAVCACSCGVVGPAGAVIAGAAAAGGGGGGGEDAVPLPPFLVSIGSSTPPAANVAYDAGDTSVVQFRISNDEDVDVDISSITLTADGTADDSTDIVTVKLYADLDQDGQVSVGDVQLGSNQTFSADNGTATFTFPARTIVQGAQEFYIGVLSFNGTADHNETVRLGITQNTDVVAVESGTATSIVPGGAPAFGNFFTLKTAIGTVTVAATAIPSASDVSFVGEWPIIGLSFTTGASEDVDITSVTLNHVGGGSTSDVSQVRLYHDVNGNGRYDTWYDVFLGSGTYFGNSVTISSFTLQCTASTTTYALAQHVMAGNNAMISGEDFQVNLNPAGDIAARGHVTLDVIVPGGGIITGPIMTVQRNVWRTVSSSGLSTRYYLGAASMGTDFAVWGGQGASYYGSGAIYHPLEDTWTTISNTGAPTGRRQHCMVWTGKELFVWGGYDGTTYLGNGKLYDPATTNWRTISSVNAPASRIEAVAVWSGSKVIVWGGYNGDYLETGGIYDPETDTWTSTDTLGTYAPDGRRRFDGAWNGTQLAIWGGFNSSSFDLADGAALNPVTNTWSLLPAAGAPPERRYHTVTWCSDRLVIFGGYNSTDLHLDDGASLYGAGWSDLATSGAPSVRQEHTSVWSGKLMIVWGGENASQTLQTGARLDPATGTWYTLSTTSAPSGRVNHGAGWTAGGMVVWGGNLSNSGSSPTGTGGRYLP